MGFVNKREAQHDAASRNAKEENQQRHLVAATNLAGPVEVVQYPTTRLNSAHNTFIRGEDKPLPGGLAKGDGNPSPETPCT